MANEISLITSRERALLWWNPVPARLLLSFSVELRSGRDAPMAGNRPNKYAGEERDPEREDEHPPINRDCAAILADPWNVPRAHRQ